MRVWVVNDGQKSLFYQGRVDRETAKLIRRMVKWYFGWRRISAMREGRDVYLFNGDQIETWRRSIFEKAGA